jgi:hypothetical protein
LGRSLEAEFFHDLRLGHFVSDHFNQRCIVNNHFRRHSILLFNVYIQSRPIRIYFRIHRLLKYFKAKNTKINNIGTKSLAKRFKSFAARFSTLKNEYPCQQEILMDRGPVLCWWKQ